MFSHVSRSSLFTAILVYILPRMAYGALLGVTVVWIMQAEGGLGFTEASLFGWHALFMVLAFPVCMTEAILTFKTPLLSLRLCCWWFDKRWYRYMHGSWHILTCLFVTFAIVAITQYKHEAPPVMVNDDDASISDNDSNNNNSADSDVNGTMVFVSGYNKVFPMFKLFSPHAWLGLTTLVLWLLVAVVRYLQSYVFPKYPNFFTDQTRKNIHRMHVFCGRTVYFTALACCAMGFQDMQSSDLAGVVLVQPATISYSPFGTFAQLACAGALLCMFVGVCVYLSSEIHEMVKDQGTPESTTKYEVQETSTRPLSSAIEV